VVMMVVVAVVVVVVATCNSATLRSLLYTKGPTWLW
jgi:hypothetical protein